MSNTWERHIVLCFFHYSDYYEVVSNITRLGDHDFLPSSNLRQLDRQKATRAFTNSLDLTTLDGSR